PPRQVASVRVKPGNGDRRDVGSVGRCDTARRIAIGGTPTMSAGDSVVIVVVVLRHGRTSLAWVRRSSATRSAAGAWRRVDRDRKSSRTSVLAIMRLTVGPLPAAVYWRRRAAVLGGLLVIVLLIVYSCAGSTPSSADQGRRAGSGGATPSTTPSDSFSS